MHRHQSLRSDYNRPRESSRERLFLEPGARPRECKERLFLEAGVDRRDEEIERLNRMLDGGRPSDIDFLQQKNREMDRKMNEALATRDEYESMSSKMNLKTRQLEAKNKELEYDLNDVDRMAKRLQCDKEIVVKEADREMTEAKDELEKSRHELEDLDHVVAELKAVSNQSLSRQQAELKQQLSVKNGDLMRLEELLDRVTEDKKRISHRVNKLMTNEKELVLEIERLKKKNGPALTKKGKTSSKLDAFIRSIEEERNYYRDQADALQKLREAAGTPTSKSDKKTVAQYETVIRVMEEEKEYYKKEYEILKATKKTITSARATPTKVCLYNPLINTQNKNNICGGLEDPEVSKLIRERDEMKALLDKFERHMAEIQANVKVLTAERDKLSTMYDETKDELQRIRRELVRVAQISKNIIGSSGNLKASGK
ncbi:CEP135 [Mytilus edulis]|uniref:CEP135 n=1 Tax=Mytilus edulis TaxID=6550 RepID=A0A8S3TMF6_MYTED|nr:CEP135 [Mytilus edulis]